MMKPCPGLYCGLDVGTSGCKALIADEDGRVIASARRSYDIISPRPGWLELDAEQVFGRVLDVLGECRTAIQKRAIVSMAVSTQGEAIIPVDKDGKVLHNGILTFDNRNIASSELLGSRITKSEIMKKTGAPLHPMFSLTKVMWFAENEPAIYQKADKFLCFGEFISMRLGAEPCIDRTMAARTMAFDINTLSWSDEIINIAGIDYDKLPRVVESGTVICRVSAPVARKTGINDDMLLVAGAHDQLCCALGAGVADSGAAMDSLGTTESIVCVSDRLVVSEEMIKNNVPCYPYVCRGMYSYLTFLSCCGAAVQWLAQGLLNGVMQPAELDGLCESLPVNAGLFVLPHFAGTGTPALNPRAKAEISGLTLSTTAGDLHRAILESTAFEARMNVEVMRRCGIEPHTFRCIGGGAKSRTWLQIKADVLGLPMTAMRVEEAGCYGAAMLALKGYKPDLSLEKLSAQWAGPGTAVEPNLGIREVYDEKYERYKELYINRAMMNGLR